jgi:amidase
VGLQLIAPEGREAELLALAAQLEAVERWHEKRPPHAPGPAAG